MIQVVPINAEPTVWYLMTAGIVILVIIVGFFLGLFIKSVKKDLVDIKKATYEILRVLAVQEKTNGSVEKDINLLWEGVHANENDIDSIEKSLIKIENTQELCTVCPTTKGSANVGNA